MALAPARPQGRRIPLPSPGVLAVGVCLLALLAAAWVATAIFDRLPHVEDDVAFLFQARTLASGRLLAPAPALPQFFEIPFTVQRDGFWYGKYPPGYPAVLALGVLAGQPWLVEPICGAIAVGLVYLLGRHLYGPWVGLLGAGLTAASPFFLLQAGSFMSHAACLAWATLFLWLFLRARQRLSLWQGLAAGAALGMLFLSRQLTAVGVALPVALWCLADLVGQRRRLGLYLATAAGFLPFLAILLAYNQLTTGNPLRSAYELYWAYDKIGFGPDVGVRGHYLADGLLNTRINFDAFATFLFGWPGQLSLAPAALAVLLAGAALAARLGGGVLDAARGIVLRGPSGSRRREPERAEALTTNTEPERAEALTTNTEPERAEALTTNTGSSSFVVRTQLPPARGSVRFSFLRRRPSDGGGQAPAPGDTAPAPHQEQPLGRSDLPRDWAGYDLLLAAVFASLVLVHVAYWAFGQMYGPRYYFEALGAVALLSARGLVRAGQALANVLARLVSAGRARSLALAAVGCLVVGLFAWSYTQFAPGEFGKTVRWYDIDGSGPRAVRAAGVHNAVVFVKHSYWTDYAPFFSNDDPLLQGDVVYAIDLGPSRDRDLLALYPGRAAYTYADGQVTPLP